MRIVKVNPTFRIDVDGHLFKNKHKNKDIQETIIFNDLLTRLAINKGDLPYFPSLGLKQYLSKFNFSTEAEIAQIVTQFESDMESQLNRDCRVHYELEPDSKHVNFSLEIDGLEYPIDFVYSGTNDSIRIIEPQFVADNEDNSE